MPERNHPTQSDLLDIIRTGATCWNQWRKANPRQKLNLGLADLREAALSGVDLRLADLRRANLRESILNVWVTLAK